MPTYEGLRLKIRKYWRCGLANYRKKKLKLDNFTIISNNCWGGMIYESYNLPKQTPTTGLFFMADDYLKFVANLKEYLHAELEFINPSASKWYAQNVNLEHYGEFPVGKLEIFTGGGTENIEIFFLHYRSCADAKEKWIRRVQRIDWDHLLIKFNDQNGCTENHLKAFSELEYKNKICFTVRKDVSLKDVVYIHAPRGHQFIRASYEPFGASRFCNINDIINAL